MAKKKRIDLDKLRATSKVRYGRANLTVEQWVSIHGTPVEQVLRDHRQGRASAEDVAWSFVKEQVTHQTPSFHWDEVELDRLLPRIIAVAQVPKLKAKSADELVSELEEVGERERERWERLNETIRRTILPILPKIGPAIPADFLNLHRPETPKLPISEAARLQVLQTNKQLAETVKANPNLQVPGIVDPKVIESLRVSVERLNKTIMPQVPPLGIDLDRLNQLTGFQPGGEWFDTLKRLGEIAREAGAPVAADAAEATLGESELEPLEVDLEANYERLKELFGQLAPDDSFRRRAIEGLILHFMIRFIEHVLAGS